MTFYENANANTPKRKLILFTTYVSEALLEIGKFRKEKNSLFLLRSFSKLCQIAFRTEIRGDCPVNTRLYSALIKVFPGRPVR